MDSSKWVTQCSTLGSLLFLIYINELVIGISSNCRLFTDDTSIFSVVPNVHTSKNNLNNELVKINKWTHHWEMGFNPDPSKYSQEVIFSRKIKKRNHLVLIFNEKHIKKRNHLVLIFNENHIKKRNHLVLIFNENHIKKRNHPMLIFNKYQIKKQNHPVLIFNKYQIKNQNHPSLVF